MRKSVVWWIAVTVVLLVLILVIFVRGAQMPSSPAALPLTNTFDQSPSGFTLKYPDDWEFIIPTLGIFVLGPPQTLYDNEPGPILTVQRAEPLSVVGTLDNALDRFLQNGPLRMPERWQITAAVTPIQFEGRDARAVELQGSDNDNAPTLHTRITATSADNTFVYFFISSVPVDKQANYELTFDAMLATVRILE